MPPEQSGNGKAGQDGFRERGDFSRAKGAARNRRQGATDLEIHDTVLIASAFCMYNRYVDGLDTWQPRDEPMYTEMGRHLAEHGYTKPSR